MTTKKTRAKFEAVLQRPADPGPGPDADWAFVLLPKAASDLLPRRGRTSVDGTLAGAPFRATLEPDGQRSHWLKVDTALRGAAGVEVGDSVAIELWPLDAEPDPALPEDLAKALRAHPDARASWDSTTPLARVDWIHWIESAKQEKTRAKRVAEACDKLASGQRAVCCFDPSGFYSKAFKPPRAGD